MGGISVWQLLILLVIVVLLFGTKKLKSLGKDAGDAVKGFKEAVSDGEKDAAQPATASVEHKSAAETSVANDTAQPVEVAAKKKESEPS